MTNVKFFQGQESNLDNLSKKAGQVLLALNNNEVSLYYDINSNTRIKLNAKNADTANRLTNSRTILTNLSSTTSASFNGTSNITPGITSTLSIAHGGTGATTAADAREVADTNFLTAPYGQKADAIKGLNITEPVLAKYI